MDAAETSSRGRDHRACRTSNTSSLTLCRKSLLTSGFKVGVSNRRAPGPMWSHSCVAVCNGAVGSVARRWAVANQQESGCWRRDLTKVPLKEIQGAPDLGLSPDTDDFIIFHAGPQKSGTGALTQVVGGEHIRPSPHVIDSVLSTSSCLIRLAQRQTRTGSCFN